MGVAATKDDAGLELTDLAELRKKCGEREDTHFNIVVYGETRRSLPKPYGEVAR